MSDVAVTTARRLSRINTSYLQAKVLQTACELDLFDWLQDNPSDAGRICEHFHLQPGVGSHFLDALTGLELLERVDGVYSNRPELVPFLTSPSPTYLGGSFTRHSRFHFPMWEDLAEALRLGSAPSAPLSGVGMAFEFFDPIRARQGFVHMDAFNSFVAEELITALDWESQRTVVDIGGSRGNVVSRLVQAYSHLTGKVFDMKAMVELFDEHQTNLGTQQRVSFYGGDFRTDPLPEGGDVYILGHILPYWPEETRILLVKRVYEVMNEGGTLLIYDNMIEPGSIEPYGHLLSLLSSVSRIGGEEYTTDDCCSWVMQAGFRVERIVPLPGTVTLEKLLVARKDA